MSKFDDLTALGQSLWLDQIERGMLENGAFAELVRRGEVRGVTSNPTIFYHAISGSNAYDSAGFPMAWAGQTAQQMYEQLTVEDIRAAADVLHPLYDQTGGGDGYVSLEVSPYLAYDTEGTVGEARHLWDLVDRPNLMIKIPATEQGLPAIRRSLAAGLNINITLIFSLKRYRQVIDAYLSALEDRLAAGLAVDGLASVASFFVSRIDTKVDTRLEALIRQGGQIAERARALQGKAAVASAKGAYQIFLESVQGERFARLRERGARVQRPLWGSTSTKNPAYSDVLYVESLIGSDTVNTLPLNTLQAFRDHGKVARTLEQDPAAASDVLAGLETLGVSMDRVTQELEDEGVKQFADSYEDLIKALQAKRDQHREGLQALAPAVTLRLSRMEKDRSVQRLFDHDASLWSQDAQAQAEIRQRLGWLDAPASARALTPELGRLAEDARREGLTDALLLGMGGSSLGAEVLANVLGRGEGGLRFSILDSIDPEQVRLAARRAPVEKTLFLVASKSGGTAEVEALLNFFWARAVSALGERAGSHFLAITDPGTALEHLAQERGFRGVLHGEPTIGGRYSVLSAFGLVPAALMGQNVEELLGRAEAMRAQCLPQVPDARNPGLVLGALLGEAALAGQDKFTFLADAPLGALGAWLEQLIAESSGKDGKGMVPVVGEPPLPPESYGKDRLFVYLRLNGGQDRRLAALARAGHPVITIPLRDPYDLGAEFYRWGVAVAVACSILGVNAFDQPNVAESKERTQAKLAVLRNGGQLEQDKPLWQGAGMALYGPEGLSAGKGLQDALGTFLAGSKPGDYVAINAFVPRTPRLRARLQELRGALAKSSGHATMLGFGPRFLHSTGQLHKGGPNKGLFVVVTYDPRPDMEIPGLGVRFGQMLLAQGLADYEALEAHERRVVRIHLQDLSLLDELVGLLVP
jgi:transaldolase/glucose-6-phosphate isomerase